MKASTIQWHLARDNALKLARFCEKNRTKQSKYGDIYKVAENESYFQIMYQFDNDGFIRAELRAGDETKGYTVADHFQVVDYSLGESGTIISEEAKKVIDFCENMGLDDIDIEILCDEIKKVIKNTIY